MDPQLAKAEPISDGGSASVVTYLRRKKNLHKGIFQPERGLRALQTLTRVKKEGEDVLQVLEQRFPCSLW